MSRIIVVGAGINGVTAAIELKKRGHEVVLVDPGPLPHSLAASTDISKAVRATYGADDDYTALADRSIKVWRQWNKEFGTDLYHEVGAMFVRRRNMEPGDFEYESLKLLEKRGLKVARMDTPQLWKRFPAWNPELYRDGVLEIEAGYSESGRAVAMLTERATSAGVAMAGRTASDATRATMAVDARLAAALGLDVIAGIATIVTGALLMWEEHMGQPRFGIAAGIVLALARLGLLAGMRRTWRGILARIQGGKPVAADDPAAKRMGMLSGIAHTLWLLALAGMVFPV